MKQAEELFSSRAASRSRFSATQIWSADHGDSSAHKSGEKCKPSCKESVSKAAALTLSKYHHSSAIQSAPPASKSPARGLVLGHEHLLPGSHETLQINKIVFLAIIGNFLGITLNLPQTPTTINRYLYLSMSSVFRIYLAVHEICIFYPLNTMKHEINEVMFLLYCSFFLCLAALTLSFSKLH